MPARRSVPSHRRRERPALAGLLHVGRHRRGRPVLGGVLLLGALGAFGAFAAGAWLIGADRGARQPAPTGAQVGVRSGQSVPDYVTHARRQLRSLRRSTPAGRPVYALASFSRYLSPGQLPQRVDGVRVSRAYTRVPLPGLSVPVAEVAAHRIPDDVTAGMDRLAADRQRIAGDFDRLAGAATDDGQRARYRTERRSYEREAAGYRAHCACVFAVLVRGTPAALARLARRPDVRVVDPAPRLTSLTGARFTPPLPEQTGAAVPPDAPSGTPPPSAGPSATGRSTGPATGPPAGPSGPVGRPTPPPSAVASPTPARSASAVPGGGTDPSAADRGTAAPGVAGNG